MRVETVEAIAAAWSAEANAAWGPDRIEQAARRLRHELRPLPEPAGWAVNRHGAAGMAAGSLFTCEVDQTTLETVVTVVALDRITSIATRSAGDRRTWELTYRGGEQPLMLDDEPAHVPRERAEGELPLEAVVQAALAVCGLTEERPELDSNQRPTP